MLADEPLHRIANKPSVKTVVVAGLDTAATGAESYTHREIRDGQFKSVWTGTGFLGGHKVYQSKVTKFCVVSRQELLRVRFCVFYPAQLPPNPGGARRDQSSAGR